MTGAARRLGRERAHHEGSVIEALIYLSPAIALTGRKVGQAIKAAIGRWKAGAL